MSRTKSILSTLWIFVTLNYLYCDLMGLMDKSILSQFLTGNVDGMEVDETFLLLAALLMEIPMGMVLLSKTLPYKMNKLANIIAGTIKTLVMIITLFVGTATTYYLFFAAIEISTTIGIVIYAWRWKNEVMRPAV